MLADTNTNTEPYILGEVPG